ncbi:hypothetical protein PTT_08797 [Pyrenophora teres f. teres 0-1]|uniref:Uncharacterized protein n=1 Tax=Pyrenophora teres f. teres (strain 0-1) TaxID=861557 RepID=E3RKN1_PYRTT|nr:hypothetical protein PTT_08797 [Pyrenophora teres f. teres 0-1]KAE8827859.1 hypothetical protein HRS9139_07078 [Pyrenophora teres f. teres]KAE8830453.1 hypothetical protein PTNB85_07040 [Pyrenophora teres f. teres]
MADIPKIAVVGASCRLPGGVNSLESYWRLLNDQRDVSSTHRASNAKGFQQQIGKTYAVERAYHLSEDPAFFDAGFFSINAAEAEAMDPQHRLLLEVAHECLENSGVRACDAALCTTGVFAGLMHADYHDMQVRDPDNLPQYMATGTARSCAANRISHAFNWTGPSLTIDTACSSSLTALHLAAMSLQVGECDMALVTGSNLLLGSDFFVSGSQLQMLSPNGRCRTWDIKADGYARGEGVAALLLQRLDDALADGHSVEAVVRGTGIAHDGRTSTLTRPSPTSQLNLIRDTYRRSGLDTRNVRDRCHFFEAHGTGTIVGDAIEAQAIHEAFYGPATDNDNKQELLNERPLLVGAGKTIIGHLEGAAGVAAVIKAILCLQHRIVPPDYHRQEEERSSVVPSLLKTPVVSVSLPDDQILRASVNSFGFGGSNAHAIIDYSMPRHQPLSPQHLTEADMLQIGPFVFSAKSTSSLCRNLRQFADHFRKHPFINLADVAWTLRAKRAAYNVRFSCGATSSTELIHKVEAAATSPRSFLTSLSASPCEPRILAIFTGQGAQWKSMGRQLFLTSRVFKDSILRSEMVVGELGSPGIITREILANPSESRLQETTVAQSLCTAIQVAFVDLLRCAGVRFTAILGHSSGEMAAAYAAGRLSAEDAIRIAYWRGKSVQTAPQGRMMAVDMSADEAVQLCHTPTFSGRLFLAASNSPTSVTLSGDVDAILEAKELLQQRDSKNAKLLHINTAYHSGHMESCAADYMELVQTNRICPSPSERSVPWYSSTHVNRDVEDLVPTLRDSYWRDNMVQPVLFSQAIENAFRSHGHFDLALEIGPHPALRRPATQTIRKVIGTTIPYCGVMHRGQDDVAAFTQSLSFLWSHGASLDLDSLRSAHIVSNYSPTFVRNLPTYSWDHNRRYWREPKMSQQLRTRPDFHELLGSKCVSNDLEQNHIWRHKLRIQDMPWILDHSLNGLPVFPSAGFCVMALAAAEELAHGRNIAYLELQDVTFSGHVGFSDQDREREIFTRLTPLVDSPDAVFTCEAASDDEQRKLGLVFKCRIHVELGEKLEQLTIVRSIRHPFDTHRIKPAAFYQSLREEIGFSLTGLFENLKETTRRTDFASARVNDVGSTPCQRAIAAFAAAFQTSFLAFAEPGHGDMWAPFLPQTIRRVRACGTTLCCFKEPISTQIAEVVASLNTCQSGSFRADVELIGVESSAEPILQLEDLTCTISKAVATAAERSENTRKIAAQKVWEQDIRSCSELKSDAAPEVSPSCLTALERVCLYYYRKWHEEIPQESLALARTHFLKLWAFLDELLPAVANGEHQYLRAEWMQDSQESISKIQQEYSHLVDLQLIQRVGEAMPDVISKKADMLDVMMRDNLLSKYYTTGIGLDTSNAVLSAAAAKIAHRFPQLKILEIGAGTGATTKRVMEAMGSFASYTFTDISSGFFGSARELLRAWEGKVEFSILDIENEDAGVGGSYDMVIAANVLHATSDMVRTMRNVRRLLRPGGYLLMLEITGDLIRTGFTMSGLSGWWLPTEAYRRCSPRLPTAIWSDILRSTGFSGLDQTYHDCVNVERHMFSVMISRAIDDKISVPTPAGLEDGNRRFGCPNTVLYINDSESTTSFNLVDQLFSLLCKSGSFTVSFLNSRAGPPPTHAKHNIVAIAEDVWLRIWKGPDEPRKDWQQFLKSSTEVLLVRMACMHGQTQTKASLDELSRLLTRDFNSVTPKLRTLVIDDTTVSPQQASFLFEDYILGIMSGPRSSEMVQNRALWSLEPELALCRNKIWIPRIKPIASLNDAISAANRTPITREIRTGSQVVTLCMQNHGITVLAGPGMLDSPRKGNMLIDTIMSTAYAIRIRSQPNCFLYLCCGQQAGSKQRVFYFSARQSSRNSVRPEWILPTFPGVDIHASLSAINAALIALALEDTISGTGTVVIYDPEELLMSLQLDSMRKTMTIICIAHSNESSRISSNGWILVHPQALRQQIRLFIPEDTNLFIDLSRTSSACGQRIRECLPSNCIQFDWRILFSPTASCFEDPFDQSAIVSAMEKISTASVPSVINLLSLEDLAAGVKLQLSTMIDWANHGKAVRAHIRPTSPRAILTKDKYYVYAGALDSIGRSWCDFAAKNGVRHLILLTKGLVADGFYKELEARGMAVHIFNVDRSAKEAIIDDLEHIGSIEGIVCEVSDGSIEVDSCVRIAEILSQTFKEAIFIGICRVTSGNWNQDDRTPGLHYQQKHERSLTVNIPGPRLSSNQGNREPSSDIFACTGLSERDIHQVFAEVTSICLHRQSNPPSDSFQASSLFLLGVNQFPSDDCRLFTLLSHHTTKATSSSSTSLDQPPTPFLSTRELLELSKGNKEACLDIISTDLAKKLASILQTEDGNTAIAEYKSTPLDTLGCDSLVAIEIRRYLLGQFGVNVPVIYILGDSMSVGKLSIIVHDKLSS